VLLLKETQTSARIAIRQAELKFNNSIWGGEQSAGNKTRFTYKIERS